MSPRTEDPAVTAYRRRVRAELGLSEDVALPAFAFGDNEKLGSELAELVVSGPKRATVGWIAEAEALGETLPRAGDDWIVLDGHRRPRCTIRTVETFEAPLTAVDDRFAWDEGEGGPQPGLVAGGPPALLRPAGRSAGRSLRRGQEPAALRALRGGAPGGLARYAGRCQQPKGPRPCRFPGSTT